MYRQGDVLLKPVSMPPRDWKPVKANVPMGPGRTLEQTPQGLILARGEVTGHKHLLKGGKVLAKPYVAERLKIATFYGDTTPDGATVIVLDKPTDLVHEEHGTITVPAGTYQLVHQREYVPASATRDRVATHRVVQD